MMATGMRLIHRIAGSRFPAHVATTSTMLSHWKIAIQAL